MRNASRSPLRVIRRSQSGGRKGSARVRPSLAALFALVVALSPLAGLVRAQGAQKPGRPQYREPESSPSFVVYQTPDGETVCRDATLAERDALRRQPGEELRQINHLAAKDSARPDASAGLTIVLRATPQLDANPQAKQAFINAAAKWEEIITNQITVIIDVDYGPTLFGTPFSSSNVLGATATSQFFFPGNYTDVRTRLVQRASTPAESALYNSLPASSLPTDVGNTATILVASPILRALGAFPPTPAANDPAPRIGFNSAFGFDFEPADGISTGQTDFDAVAVHEIGHALGFTSEVGDTQTVPNRGGERFASLWDLFRFRPGTANPSTFSSAQRILSVGGEHVHFAGAGDVRLSTGDPSGEGGDGNQSSHWKDNVQNGGVFIGIMDPTIPRAVRETMTANDRAAVDIFGFSLTPPPPGPANDNFSAAQFIAGSSGLVNGTNIGATKEAGEPSHSPDGDPGGKSVWYNWTAPTSGPATFTTAQSPLGAGSSFDTTLAVYTGASVGALSPIIKNDDIDNGVIRTSSVFFNAVGGTTYRIAVDGWSADEGSIALSWQQDAPAPSSLQFTAPVPAVSEAGGVVVINVERTGGSGPVTVNYATSNQTAVAGLDYQAVSGTLSFGTGETLKSFNIIVSNDGLDEGPETVHLALSNPTGGASLGSISTAVLTILDDDPPPALSVADPVFAEGHAGVTVASVAVSLSTPSGLTASVNYATSDGTATAGSDYAAASGTLNFAPGEMTKIVPVAVSGDTAVEGNETFFLNLSGPLNATVADSQGVATIINDDGATGNSVIQFGTAHYIFSEATRTALITLTRTNPGVAVSVDVRTVDNGAAVGCADTTTLPGVAFARCDYATTIETVTFAAGDLSKTVNIPLIDDAHGEPGETVPLALSNPSAGAQLGTLSTATLHIGSDEPEGQTGAINPIGGNQFFVRQHYLDFLSREPEVGEPWTGVLDRCPNVNNTDPFDFSAGCDFNIVSSSFFRSAEFELKGRYAFRFYKVSFGRLPDYPEIVVDMRQLTGGTGAETVARRAAFPAAWTQRADFKAAFDSMSNTDFVNTLMNRYGLLLITTSHPSTPESDAKVQLSRTGMAGALTNGQWTRAQVLRAIADSDEVGRAEFNPSFVAMQYYGYLRRAPEPDGYNAWLNYLNQNPTDFRTMVGGFMNSVEYRLRFGAR